jgi:hypothetical protein
MSNLTHILHLTRQLQRWVNEGSVPSNVLYHELGVIEELLQKEADGGATAFSGIEPASRHGSDRQPSFATDELWDGDDT